MATSYDINDNDFGVANNGTNQQAQQAQQANEPGKNHIYFQMQGMRQGYDDIQDLDTTASPFIDVTTLHDNDISKNDRLTGSSYDHSTGDWEFTEQQKKDVLLNGRVDDIFERPKLPENSPLNTAFKTSGNVTKESPSFNISQLSGNMEASGVSTLFYSKLNIQALQDGIRNLVYTKSKGKHRIGEQSINELVIVMKSIYLAHGQNLMYNIVEQVKSLNAKVLDYCVPEILNELDMYEKYLKDQSSLPTPMDRSQNVSSKGDKILEFKGFF